MADSLTSETDIKALESAVALRAALNAISRRWLCRLHNTSAYVERTWEERALAAESERDEMYRLATEALAGKSPVETSDKPRLTGQCVACHREWTVIGETGTDVIVRAFHCPCGHTTVMEGRLHAVLNSRVPRPSAEPRGLAAQIEDAKKRIAAWPPDVRVALGLPEEPSARRICSITGCRSTAAQGDDLCEADRELQGRPLKASVPRTQCPECKTHVPDGESHLCIDGRKPALKAPQHTPATLSTCMPDCPACAYYRAEKPTATPNAFGEVPGDACIEELEWFATRKVNLAGLSGNGPEKETWADVMLSDLADLRKALADERKSQRREISRLNEALRRKASDEAPSFSPNFDERNGIR